MPISRSAKAMHVPTSRFRPTTANAATMLRRRVEQVYEVIRTGLSDRADPASKELLKSARRVLGKRGHGKLRRIYYPGGPRYHVSRPGEPPSARTKAFAKSWSIAPGMGPNGIRSPGIKTNMASMAKWFTEGTATMKPRPFIGAIMADAWPGLVTVYTQPYLEGSEWKP